MGKRVDVAYEPAACEHGEGCRECVTPEYASHVVAQLRWLGSPEPEADAEWGSEYVGNGCRAGVPPAAVGDLIYAMRRGFPHRLLRTSNPEHVGADESHGPLVLWEIHGREWRGTGKVTGDRYVVMAGGSSGPYSFGGIYWLTYLVEVRGNTWTRKESLGHGFNTEDAMAIADERERRAMVGHRAAEDASAGASDAKFERCVQKVKASGSDANPWAVCHAALGREPEPFTHKHVPWHRDGAGYYADVDPWGRIRVRQRTQDKRAGKLAWYAVIKKIEVAQGETRAAVSTLVEEHLRKPALAAATPTMAAEVAIVERSADVRPGGVVLASPKDVHRLLAERYGKMGSEVFEVLLLNLNGELMGRPVEVARGQASSVHVEPEQVIAVAIAGRAQGAAGFYACHNHPSGTLHASPADKDLTKRIEAARKVACPSMRFHGHLIVTAKGWARA